MVERVPLDMEAHAFRPAQRQLDRVPGVRGQQGGVALDAQVLLGAERAAAGDQGGEHLVLGQAEQAGDLPPVAPDALALRVEVDPAVVVG